MKKIILLCVLMVLVVGCGSSNNEDSNKLVVGIVQLAEHPSLDETVSGMKEALGKKLEGTSIEVEYKFQNAQGDLSKVDTIIQSYIDSKVDLIYAVATNAAQSAVNLTKDIDIPVVFNAVTDPVQAGIVKDWSSSDNNATGVSDMSPMDVQLGIVKKFLPNATKVGVLYNVGEANSLVQIDMITEYGKAQGLEIIAKGVANEQDLALMSDQLVKEVDALYNITDNMVVSATPLIVNSATKAGIPVFATEDGQLSQGILAAESLSYFNLGEEAGQIIYDILITEVNPTNIPVVKSTNTKLFVNEEKAAELGITIPN